MPVDPEAAGRGATARAPGWPVPLSGPGVELVTDPERTRRLGGWLRQAAREEVLTFGTAAHRLWAQVDVTGPATPGVVAKTVIDVGVLALPGADHPAHPTAGRDDPVRVVAQLPLPMMLVDRRLACVGLDPGGLRSALVTQAPALVAGLAAYFDHTWRQAIPVPHHQVDPRRADPPGPSRAQRRILPMLAAGATDQAIARRLGMSERTVRRHIAALLEQTGTTSRFACAIAVLRLGWLSLPTSTHEREPPPANRRNDRNITATAREPGRAGIRPR